MFDVSKNICLRRFILAAFAAVAVTLPFGLSGCGKAPEIPKPGQSQSQSEPNQRDGSSEQIKQAQEEPPPPPAVSAPAPAPAISPPPPPPPRAGSAPAPVTAAEAPPENDSYQTELGYSRSLPKPGAATNRAGTAAQPADGSKGYDVVPVFFGTDRAVEPDPKRLQFSAERGLKLTIGRAMITVPEAHKVPNVERPWAIEIPYFKVKVFEQTEDPKQHFTVQDIGALSNEQMLAFVKERLAKSASFKNHAFVFVHGFNTSFDAALYRTAQIAYDMKFDGVPFVYSWPSGGKVASYTYDRGSVEQAEPHLAAFLDLVLKQSGAKSISLIAHSMGNELLLRVLERMRGAAPKDVQISQVILAAPDVDRDKFNNIAREVASFAKGVTLYAASNDKALNYSARFWGGVPRAGDVPKEGPLVIPGVDTIDCTAVSTESFAINHSGYAEKRVLLDDIAALIKDGTRPPDKRLPALVKVDTQNGAFWRYSPPK